MTQRPDLFGSASVPKPRPELRETTLTAVRSAMARREPAPAWPIRWIDRLAASRIARWSWATAMGLLLLANVYGVPESSAKRSAERQQLAQPATEHTISDDDDFAALSESPWLVARDEESLADTSMAQLEAAL